MSYFCKTIFFTLFSCLLFLSGCNSDESKIKSEKLNSGVLKGKSFSPIGIKYQAIKSGNAEVGENYEIVVSLTSRIDTNSMTIYLTTKGDIFLVNTEKVISLGKMVENENRNLTLTVNPSANGLHYIYLSVNAETEGLRKSGSFAIPVYVGDKSKNIKSKVTGVIQEDSSGEKIIHMPAVETTE